MTFELYRDRGGWWRWRAVYANGRKAAASGESFHSKSNARRAAEGHVYAIERNYESAHGIADPWQSTLKSLRARMNWKDAR